MTTYPGRSYSYHYGRPLLCMADLHRLTQGFGTFPAFGHWMLRGWRIGVVIK